MNVRLDIWFHVFLLENKGLPIVLCETSSALSELHRPLATRMWVAFIEQTYHIIL